MIFTNTIYAVVFAFSGTLNINVMVNESFGWSRLYVVHRSHIKEKPGKCAWSNPRLG